MSVVQGDVEPACTEAVPRMPAASGGYGAGRARFRAGPEGSGGDEVIELRIVSVLCAAPRSVYRDLPGVEVYDRRRDARTFAGDTPIVAHPPCRGWSAKTRHQAKPEPGEMDLGLWCVEQLRRCGGVLEQPAFSHLFAAAGLPRPGNPGEWRRDGEVWSIAVWQAWWGYPMRKATWLAFCRVPYNAVQIPFRLHSRGNDRRAEQVMSRQQRSATPRDFAEWLVSLARLCDGPSGHVSERDLRDAGVR